LSMQSCIHAVCAELRDCVSCKLTAASQRELCSVRKLQFLIIYAEKSLCEICFYQKSENLIFFKIIFICLVHEINKRNHQFQHSALNVIQVTAEFILTTLFKYDIKIIVHHDCVTLTVRNTQLIMNIMKTLR
ncbi:hypothetical protein BDDG_13386, partial [Blastomyces dermatitidis ATCC 18188]